MTTPITPIIPPEPSGDSTPEQWRLYIDAVSAFNRVAQVEATEKHAEAQRLTAVAMDRHAAAQEAMIEALAGQPQSSGFSEAFVMSLLRLVLEKPEPA